MLILSMNNRFDELAIFLARFLHNYKKRLSIHVLIRWIHAHPVSLFGMGTTKSLVVYIEGPLLLFQTSRWLARPTFFRSCRLICSDKEGSKMYTICRQMLTIASTSGVSFNKGAVKKGAFIRAPLKVASVK